MEIEEYLDFLAAGPGVYEIGGLRVIKLLPDEFADDEVVGRALDEMRINTSEELNEHPS